MLIFPNCKINLGLRVVSKRKDGYHNIETIFYPLPVKDGLEIITNNTLTDTNLNFSTSGLKIDGDSQNNLCVKAYQLLKKDFPELPSINMHLHKVIPMGAGLGGGSADGAFALKLLNQQFKLGITINKLEEYALQLGSDCPFFINNKPSLALSRGEILQPIDLDLSLYKLAFINPGIHVNTAWAFSQLNILPENEQKIDAEESLSAIMHRPVKEWKDCLFNDFEVPVFSAYPLLKELKETMYSHGADYAAMTGSGSTIFGLFKKEMNVEINIPASYTYKLVNL